MAKTTLLSAQPHTRLAPLVKQHADALRPKWLSVVASAREFIPALLSFAVSYRDAYTEVKDNLGNDAVKALNSGIGLTDTAASRLRDIAEAHGRLSPHAALLPASVDAIHSLAVLATDLRGVNYFCRLATTIPAGEGSAKECGARPARTR
jgi:hypothetical protein